MPAFAAVKSHNVRAKADQRILDYSRTGDLASFPCGWVFCRDRVKRTAELIYVFLSTGFAVDILTMQVQLWPIQRFGPTTLPAELPV